MEDWLRESVREMREETREYFGEVRRDLAEIKSKVAVMEANLHNLGDTHAAEVVERKELEKRVSALEAWKWKLAGMMTVGSALISLLVGLAGKLIGE